MYLLFIFFAYGMFNSCETIIPGSRLLDFPNPDFSHFITLPDQNGQSFAEVEHGFGSIPFHVRVYATSSEGDNANFVFEGTGACQNDLRDPDGPFGGVIFAYNKELIKIWTPKTSSRKRMGSIIFVGGGWGGDKYKQTSFKAKIVVQAWKSGPLPTFETQMEISTKAYNTIKIPHLLQQLPEMVSVRVHASNGKLSDLYFHATSAAQSPTKSRLIAGVLFAYNITDIVIWTPNRSKTGCVGVGKKWGKGKAVFSQNCYINVRIWINSFPPPIFQSDWMTVNANDQKNSFIELKHDVKLLPTYIRVQYRFKDIVNPLVFEGSGSVQTTNSSKSRYGGVLFAYDKLNVRIWLPGSPKKDQAYIIFIGDGWGDKKSVVYNVTAELRVQVFVDKCMDKKRVVDAQGYCRDISEIQLIQKMGPWAKCTNPCGNGTKTRNVEGCNGRSLQVIIDCNFEKDNCGFRQSGFNWTRSTDVVAEENQRCPIEITSDLKQMKKSSQFIKEVKSKQKHFIYSRTKPCIGKNRVHMPDGRLISKDLNNAEGCVLTFKYAAESYYGKLMVQALPSKSKTWKDDLWFIEDGQVRRGVWHSGYIDVGHYVGSVKKIRFIHKLPYSSSRINSKCPQRCHSIMLTNITLKCEKIDLHVVSKETCDEKRLPLSSCIVNAFKPHLKGPAWGIVHNVRNKANESVGSFVTAVGEPGDLIAAYTFDIKMFNDYHLWFNSFATDNKTNAVIFEINDEERYEENLIYTGKSPLWLPLEFILPIQAGKHTIRLYQKEKYFKFRNLMIAPKNISVYSALGMQSHLIPDNNFVTLGGISTLFGFSRLNGKGAWIPSDNTKGKFYLEIQFPDIALVNKITTQGGRSLGKPESYICWTDSYKMKFSLDRTSFAYYRKKIKEEAEYEFKGNTDADGIVEHKLSYTVVARAIRIYPYNYTWQACLRLEIYGFYMVKGMCPELIAKTIKKNCTGNGICNGQNMHCVKDRITLNSKCGCTTGYHGLSCNNTGCDPDPCKSGSNCIIDGGSFKCQCKAGFYGRYCETVCPKGLNYGVNCLEKCNCTENEYCDPKTGDCSCLPGYLGLKCDNICPNGTYGQDCLENCTCQPPLKCDHRNGDCYCPEGFKGDFCDIRCENGTYGRNCSKGCKCFNGGICDADGKCDCPPGWFNEDCQFECPDGRYGKMCSSLCHENLHGNSTCNKITGILTCAKGFKGTFCDKVCSQGQYGENCKYTCQCSDVNTQYCRKDTGQCICKPGWKGDGCYEKCENTFGYGCRHKCRCKNGGKCNNVDGSCTCLRGHNGTHCQTECIPGYYGYNCANTCDCIEKQTDKCDPINGHCYCMSGYKGKHCKDECDRNHWGMNCDERCTCLNNALCDSSDGFCFCTKGFTGDNCEKKCDHGKFGRNCESICDCRNGGLCERFEGNCDCQPGFNGKNCEKKCEDGQYGKDCKFTCKCHKPQSVKCNHVNGSCLCKPGYQGVYCEDDCYDGFYGDGCKKPCQPCRHSLFACNKINGNCSCIDGFTGLLCMDDCKMGKYGPGCTKTCLCDEKNELCDNMDGQCYQKKYFTFIIDLLLNRYTFNYLDAKEELKENLALLIWNCFKDNEIDQQCIVTNASDYVHVHLKYINQSMEERMMELRLSNTFFVRIVDIKSRFSVTNQEVTTITFTLLNNTRPVNGSIVRNYLSEIPAHVLSKALKYDVYKGDTTFNKKKLLNIPRWIVIGLSGFGGLLTVFLICFICRCTKRVPYPPPFQKVRRDSKDFEMQPSMNCNTHILAFENPYYDVIAAMGFDDIEEDYYNPLYDNMLELQSDSETEPEDMYYSFRNNNYRHGAHYPYDKDSGFSSGTLM